MGNCKFVDSYEIEYMKNLLNYDNLQDIINDFVMTSSTAFNSRNKILTFLKEYYEKGSVLDGRVEADKFFWQSLCLKNLNLIANESNY